MTATLPGRRDPSPRSPATPGSTARSTSTSAPTSGSSAATPALAAAEAPRRRWDAATMLGLYLVLLLGIPSIVVFKGLGSVGSPATMFGVALFAWWAVTRMAPRIGSFGPQPMRRAVGLLLASAVASYIAAGLRGYDGLEQRAADRGLLLVVSLIGATCVAADGIRSRERLDALLRVIVLLGAAMSVVGLLQFRSGFDVAVIFNNIPVLTFNGTDNFVFDVGVRRVASTAGHPIEFGMILTLILPIALHRAFHAPAGRARGAWMLAALVGLGIPLSISRSAVVSLVVALIVLLVGWPSAQRRWALKAIPLFLVVIRLVAPGTLGTLWTGLLGLQNDPSIQGRANNRALVSSYLTDRPFFGRGFGTFLPDRYVLLDNQYLGIIVELGYLGLTAVLAVFIVGFVLAVRIRRRTTDAATRDLAIALAASVAAAMAGLATFDGFGFAGFTGLLFVLFGCIGALSRLTPADPTPASTAASTSPSMPRATTAPTRSTAP